MKKDLNMLRTFIVIIFIFNLSGCGYNDIQTYDEQVNASWSEVLNQYQRRADLVPNLVNTVKGYAAHESETLEAVIAARSKATQITVDPANLTEENLQKYQEAQGELSSALGKLLAITENYPDLKANQNFLELQAQLEGTENRIATERSRYTDAVNAYNKKIRKFPALITAKIFGFDAKPQFKAEASATQAPTVEF